MSRDVGHCCELMTLYLDEREVAVKYVPKFREYGVLVLDGGSSYVQMAYCPWCGSTLPETLRHHWLEDVRNLGLEPGSPNLPEKYRGDEWWRG